MTCSKKGLQINQPIILFSPGPAGRINPNHNYEIGYCFHICTCKWYTHMNKYSRSHKSQHLACELFHGTTPECTNKHFHVQREITAHRWHEQVSDWALNAHCSWQKNSALRQSINVFVTSIPLSLHHSFCYRARENQAATPPALVLVTSTTEWSQGACAKKTTPLNSQCADFNSSPAVH